MPSISRLNRRLAAAIVVWASAAGGGLYAVTAHGAAPGNVAEAPASLAGNLRSAGRATIVVTAHPSCPCTRATLHELARIAREVKGAADIVLLFAGKGDRDRVAAELRRSAEGIAGARVVEDPDRAIAKSLGAHTPGTVLFYDTRGALRFSGGITRARGHEGSSAGADTLRSLVAETGPSAPATTPVYGCPLASRTSNP